MSICRLIFSTAKLYFEAGRFDRAAGLYEEVSYHPQAAKCYENMGESIKAADNYEKHWSATTSFGGGGLIAAPSEREAKVALKAGQLYEQAGVDLLLCLVNPYKVSHDEVMQTIELLGNHVIPEFDRS